MSWLKSWPYLAIRALYASEFVTLVEVPTGVGNKVATADAFGVGIGVGVGVGIGVGKGVTAALP